MEEEGVRSLNGRLWSFITPKLCALSPSAIDILRGSIPRLLLAPLVAFGVGFLIWYLNRTKKSERDNKSLEMMELPVNVPPVGPLGLGILPTMRDMIKSSLLSVYLHSMYRAEIAGFADGPLLANSAVAHACEDEEMNTMNIAMYDNSPAIHQHAPST